MSHANAWKEAQSSEERKTTFNAHGIRWSELLRLPYWDVTKFVAIDSMHCFYLRMFRRHIREIWGMDVEYEDGDGISFHIKNMPSEQEMTEGNVIFHTGTKTTLSGLRRDVLAELCRGVGLRFAGTKKQLLQRLIAYVSAIQFSLSTLLFKLMIMCSC